MSKVHMQWNVSFWCLSVSLMIVRIHYIIIMLFNLPCFLSGSSDEVFSLALYHFNHTLVTSDLPSPALQVSEMLSFQNYIYSHYQCCHFRITNLIVVVIHFQNTLLQQLGIAPFSEGPWPLYIHPQSLSVLSRLLLIWQHKASVQGEPDVPECMKVWERYGICLLFCGSHLLWTCWLMILIILMCWEKVDMICWLIFSVRQFWGSFTSIL